ncbi:hypothetical protein [uncultured Roseobacter sp.]|uniref:hypothetical protein n=1 Tax=uncultured Roseobacter sp. TaxID=114847 RepID=UPI00262D6369|nr:hypothetical protein [uncultured Roseobacter sp.]
MERTPSIVASIVTIAGFLMTLSQISEMRSFGFSDVSEVQPLIGSLFFALVAIILSSLCFGYVFSFFSPLCERNFGRISVIVATPLVGIVSGFQTGAVTLFLSRVFEIGPYLGFIIAVSFVFSAMVETMFLFRRFAIVFPMEARETWLGDEFPKYSLGHSITNFLFFALGAFAFLLDSGLIVEATGILFSLLGFFCVWLFFLRFWSWPIYPY